MEVRRCHSAAAITGNSIKRAVKRLLVKVSAKHSPGKDHVSLLRLDLGYDRFRLIVVYLVCFAGWPIICLDSDPPNFQGVPKYGGLRLYAVGTYVAEHRPVRPKEMQEADLGELFACGSLSNLFDLERHLLRRYAVARVSITDASLRLLTPKMVLLSRLLAARRPIPQLGAGACCGSAEDSVRPVVLILEVNDLKPGAFCQRSDLHT